MRVLRTVTIEYSAETKNPLANTSASTPARRHMMPATECSMTTLRNVTFVFRDRSSASGFSIRKEMRVDERVDDCLVGRIHDLELDAHADPAIAPGDASFGVDVLLAAGHAEPHFDFRCRVERACS